MKSKLFLALFFFGFAITGFAQHPPSWEKWSWLIGKWQGEGSGQPGKGGGVFSFSADLQNNILVRKAHSEYPAAANKPAVIHDDLLIVYADPSGIPAKAIYFDNEGHTINYSVSYAEKTIVFLTAKAEHMPVFRLTYSLLDDEMINTKFEISQDGEKFMTYIEGKSRKIKN